MAVPGRVRLRIEGLRGRSEVAGRLTEHLIAHGAIQRVSPSTITGNLLVLFDPRQLDLAALTGVIIRVVIGAPAAPAPSQPTREVAWHALPATSVLDRLATRPEKGLSSAEAAARLAVIGANGLPEPIPKSAAAIAAGHLTTLPVLLLGGAALLSVASGALVEAVVILAVIGINATVGFITERRVERILTSLRTTAAPPAVVRRDGRERSLPPAELVPGDIILLRAGNEVPADARLLFTDGLAVDESALTGESLPVRKAASEVCASHVPLAERANMVFAGTLVAEGTALAVITATGRHSELGRVRTLVAESIAPETPLERQLGHMGRQLVAISLGFCGLTFVVGLLRGLPTVELARMVISLAVAAVPEGLPAVATTTLALGMRHLMTRRTIVRRLAAVESLGATTVICADKTGTVTENRMTAHSWHLVGRAYRAPLDGDAIDQDLMRALAIGALCNEADLANGGLDIQGSSTEGALLRAAVQAGLDYRALRQRYPLLAVRPRNDGDSWMATVHADGPQWLVAVKGAPEQVLQQASRQLVAGVEHPMTEDARREILDANARIAARGMRVLGLACKQAGTDANLAYDDLVWVALVALTDPVRAGVREAIAVCRRAGIRTVLVTGDQAQTAVAIARELGLGHEGEVRVAEASALAALNGGDELLALVREVDVFARVSPAHKYKIVQALQAGGDVVAMTGDGINDAAALRAAVIGVAMGERGTDVARDVADVVLLKDDFSAVVDAIEQGRTIRDNVERSVRYLLATNFSEILVTLAALALGGPRPFSAIQLLWINLLSDVFPALALAVEPPGPDVMSRPPRPPDAPILSRDALGHIARDASVLAATAIGARAVALARYGPGPQAGTVGFCALTAAQLVHAFNCQASADAGVVGVASSPRLAGVIGGSLALQVVAATAPPLRALLGLTPLSLIDWALVAASAALPLVAGSVTGGRGGSVRS